MSFFHEIGIFQLICIEVRYYVEEESMIYLHYEGTYEHHQCIV